MWCPASNSQIPWCAPSPPNRNPHCLAAKMRMAAVWKLCNINQRHWSPLELANVYFFYVFKKIQNFLLWKYWNKHKWSLINISKIWEKKNPVNSWLTFQFYEKNYKRLCKRCTSPSGDSPTPMSWWEWLNDVQQYKQTKSCKNLIFQCLI